MEIVWLFFWDVWGIQKVRRTIFYIQDCENYSTKSSPNYLPIPSTIEIAFNLLPFHGYFRFDQGLLSHVNGFCER